MEFKGTLLEYLDNESKMNRFINLLKILDDDSTIVKTCNYIIREIQSSNKDLLAIYSLADELLITDRGDCNWINIERLKNDGYDVFAGKQDKSGWLSGCIETKKGILVFG